MANAPEYWLQIIFKSNERPWRHNRYEPYPRLGMTQEEAIEWAAYFNEQIGSDYQITLYEDGKVLDYGSAKAD